MKIIYVLYSASYFRGHKKYFLLKIFGIKVRVYTCNLLYNRESVDIL